MITYSGFKGWTRKKFFSILNFASKLKKALMIFIFVLIADVCVTKDWLVSFS